MSDREWWETAQQLGLSWLSPRKDCSPSDEILCMLSDLCTKENLPPPSYQQFPAANGTFSSICQVGDHTKESYGESADIALRNAAVTMLIFLKEIKAAAVTHQLKEKYDVNQPTFQKEILSFHEENGSKCEGKDEDEMFQKRFAVENEIAQNGKLEDRSRLGHRPPVGIEKLYTQKSISTPKKPMNKKEVSDFGNRCIEEGRYKNKKGSKREKHYPPVMEPQGRPCGYTKQNIKDYPPEILKMYQSYEKEYQSSGKDLLSLDEIWNQCVADSILPDSLLDNQTTFQRTTPKKTPANGIETTFQCSTPKKTPANGIQIKEFQSRINDLNESNYSKLEETWKFKDGKQYRSEMMRHASAHLSKADDQTFLPMMCHASGHLSKADDQTFLPMMRHASGHLSKADDQTFLPMGEDVPKIPHQESQCKVQENGVFDSRCMLPGSIEEECLFQNNQTNDSIDELSQEFIHKLEKMQIERVSPQKHKSLNGFFLILKSSRNPGMGKLRYSKLVGDSVAQLEEICEEEKIAFVFEEEEIEVHRGVDDEWLSVLRLGHDMEFIGSGSSSGEAKQMAASGALQYIKIMTR